jgi:hypothetical protein
VPIAWAVYKTGATEAGIGTKELYDYSFVEWDTRNDQQRGWLNRRVLREGMSWTEQGLDG